MMTKQQQGTMKQQQGMTNNNKAQQTMIRHNEKWQGMTQMKNTTEMTRQYDQQRWHYESQ